MTKTRAQARATTQVTYFTANLSKMVQCSKCGSLIRDDAFIETINCEPVCSSCFDKWLEKSKAIVTEVIQLKENKNA